ncbi:protein NEOXANTHIN-DEFICIENT 1 isoform X3 [Cajanus cajan]|uniref:protein NEOXANTHIN-DEFICIENT 1 isoform X3 n=1 Tax=Cajanus cajan TaxID=3821 RepID=UPI0010FB8E96|nr:protein NEOXANTHIN-DEFICIENT 1 isoform X3 [Cajanus cajan]
MEVVEEKSSSGYGKPPWVFKGSAWYQLHLVKADKARACIPKEFKLVEAFGYTLGGFFLASYEDSPVGVFDELVVIAGLVWNRPTSCAWATRVYVNNDEACYHGRKEVGLPSQMARFSKALLMRSMLIAVPALGLGHWMGPTIRMSLPSFSGGTEYNPNLLKYSCKIECRVQALKPLKVSGPFPSTNEDTEQSLEDYGGSSHVAIDHQNNAQNFSTCVMLSKPILAIKFSEMKMQVEAPVVLSQCSNSLETTVTSSP